MALLSIKKASILSNFVKFFNGFCSNIFIHLSFLVLGIIKAGKLRKEFQEMTKIVKYQNKDDETCYSFRYYAGVDKKTGKKRYIKRKGFKRLEDAKQELRKIDYEVSTGQYFHENIKMKFKEVYEEWIQQYENTVKHSTFYYAKHNIELNILPLIGDYFVDKITLRDCQTAINKIFKTNPASISHYYSYMFRILDYARRLGIIDTNPMNDVIKPKYRGKSKTNTRKFYSRDELNQFLDTAKKAPIKLYAFFRLLACSGMRIGEQLALTWNDVSFITNAISINKTTAHIEKGAQTIQSTKTKASNRVISIDKETMSILKKWKAEQSKLIGTQQNHQLVFSNRKNKTIADSVVRKWCIAICKASGLKPIKLHGFRHTHASLLLESGMPIKEVQARLGHSNVDTTLNIYAHVTRKDIDTGEQFANYLNGDPKGDPERMRPLKKAYK